jgi:hypothetical protein
MKINFSSNIHMRFNRTTRSTNIQGRNLFQDIMNATDFHGDHQMETR